MKCDVCGKNEADLLNHKEIHHITFMYFLFKADPSTVNICFSCHTKIHAEFRREFGGLVEDVEELIEKTLDGKLTLDDLLLIEHLLDWQRKLRDIALGDIVFHIEHYAKR